MDRNKLRKLHRKIILYKTVSWRIISILISVLTAFLVTGNIFTGISIGLIDMSIKTIIYWLHENKWERVRRIKKKNLKNNIKSE